MKELTKAEEKVMQILWKIERGFVKDILAQFEDPKPNYTTVSTFLRILENKEYVGHKTYGNTHEYFPIISKETYSKYLTDNVLEDYFDGSAQRLVSFFLEKQQLDSDELNELLKIIEQNKGK
jgi:BlaI family transcriptional regulator, penicillinase repressor